MKWRRRAWYIILAAVVINSAVSIAADAPQLDVVVDTTTAGVTGETKPRMENPDGVVGESKPEKDNADGIVQGAMPGESKSGEVKEEVKSNERAEERIEVKPNPIKPLYVHGITRIGRGRNDSNPAWSPSGELIAFERSIKEKKEIIISRSDGSIVQKVYYQLPGENDEMSFFFPGITEEVSYNSGVTWSPGGDRFVFMSNGGGGNYDLYLYELVNKATTRLTKHKGKDGHARWSPATDHLVFVSGRTGKADIYLMDLATKATTPLTQGDKAYLYPQWSPDGKKLVMLYGSNENHDIYLVGDVTKPKKTLKALTTWEYDDLKPVWSPDGKKVAFYSNYNAQNDPKIWAIIVIAADGSDPAEGEGLAAKVVAADIIPDVERGPAWMPDSARIVYAKNDKYSYNPLYVVDIEKKTNLPVRTVTKMNHDVICSVNGTIAFRAQVEQWDHIYITKLKN